MYNVEYEIAAEKFDQKFAPYSELRQIKKSLYVKAEEVKRAFAALS